MLSLVLFGGASRIIIWPRGAMRTVIHLHSSINSTKVVEKRTPTTPRWICKMIAPVKTQSTKTCASSGSRLLHLLSWERIGKVKTVKPSYLTNWWRWLWLRLYKLYAFVLIYSVYSGVSYINEFVCAPLFHYFLNIVLDCCPARLVQSHVWPESIPTLCHCHGSVHQSCRHGAWARTLFRGLKF